MSRPLPFASTLAAAALFAVHAAADDDLPAASAVTPVAPSVARFELFARGGYVSAPVAGALNPFGLGGGGGSGSNASRAVQTQVQPPDVIMQATSVSGSGSRSRAVASATSDAVVRAAFVEPGVAMILSGTNGQFVGVRASALYFPRVAYDADSSASWLPWALAATVGHKF